MTTDPIEQVESDADAYSDDVDDGLNINENYGQTATTVAGDMIQNVHNLLGHYRATHELSDDFVRTTIADFVGRVYDPGGLSRETAAGLLRERKQVLLVADPGTGRRTAAVGLLEGVPTRRREIPIDDDERRLLPVDEVPWSTYGRCAYLLTVPPGCRNARLPELLVAYRETVERWNSYLVVLVDRKALERPEEVSGFTVLRVSTPDPDELLSQLLRDLRLRLDVDALRNTPPLPTMLVQASPAQIARLARRIQMVATDPEEPLEEIALKAVRAYQNWDEDLFRWFDEHRDPRTRLFLIALAFLQGVSATYVLQAVERLAEELKEPADVRGGIGAPGIRQLTEQTSARIDDRLRISFALPSYNIAVLRYVHSDRSKSFRESLWRWASGLPLRRNGSPSAHVAGQIASAMLDVTRAFPQDEAPEVRVLADRWWNYQTLRPLVVELITAVALSPEAGQAMRRQLNRWAGQSKNPRLLSTVAAVCGGPLADVHPRAALTRLNNLALCGNDAVNDDIVTAVRMLWERPQHREATLRQVVGWAAANDERTGAGLRALAALSETRDRAVSFLAALATDVGLRAELTGSLALLFTGEGPQGALREAVFCWLDVAARHPEHEDLLSELLIRVGGTGQGASRRFARMINLLHDWQPTARDVDAPDAHDLRDRLVERLYRADPIAA